MSFGLSIKGISFRHEAQRERTWAWDEILNEQGLEAGSDKCFPPHLACGLLFIQHFGSRNLSHSACLAFKRKLFNSQ